MSRHHGVYLNVSPLPALLMMIELLSQRLFRFRISRNSEAEYLLPGFCYISPTRNMCCCDFSFEQMNEAYLEYRNMGDMLELYVFILSIRVA